MVKCLFQLDEPIITWKNGCFTFPSISNCLFRLSHVVVWHEFPARFARTTWGQQGGITTAVAPKVMEVWFLHNFPGWWFQICFIFTPILGKWSILTSIFFRWVETTNQFLSFNWMTLAVFQPWIFGGYHFHSLRSETPLPAILRVEGERQVNWQLGKSPPTNNCVIDLPLPRHTSQVITPNWQLKKNPSRFFGQGLYQSSFVMDHQSLTVNQRRTKRPVKDTKLSGFFPVGFLRMNCNSY